MDPNKIYEKQISENLRLYSAAKQLICAIEAGLPSHWSHQLRPKCGKVIPQSTLKWKCRAGIDD